MEDPQVRKQFDDALSSFIARAKKDTHVLGIIVYGSMAYDEVTERSNINAFVITDDGKHRTARLVEFGVPIDVQIYSRDDFMRHVQSPRGLGLLQFLTYSKLVFSRDCSLTDFYKNLNKNVGTRDRQLQQMGYDLAVRYDLSKSEKYLYIKRDLPHSFHFLIHALSELGYLLCYLNDIYPPREVILRGRELKPDLFPELFDGFIDTKVTHESLERTLRKSYEFLDTLDLDIYKPVLDFISENEGTATQTEINDRFAQGGWETIDLEHLHRRRILRRTINPVKITKKGVVEYNEAQYHFNWKSFLPDEVIPTLVGPSKVERKQVQDDYRVAAEELVQKVKTDEYVLSLMLAGSLSYDTVWEKSDLDVLIVTRDDIYQHYKALVEKDVYVDTYLFTRDAFRKLVHRVRDGSIFHSYFSKSTLLFTRDDTIHDLYEDLQNIGSRDLENLLLLNYVFCKDLINKAYKALDVKDDPHFALNFMTSGIRRMANIEVLLNRAIPLRESTAQALEFNPEFFNSIFTEFVHAPKKTFDLVETVLEKMECYLDEHLKTFIEPVKRLLEKEDEITHYDLKDHFSEIWLPIDMREFVERGLIRQTEAPFRLTKKSTAEMMQPAYQLALKQDSTTELDDFGII
ncbi:MAG: nucleotidyltransferase domain-containing protein [Candidatus Thorarchaeota archaeon]|nr:nucleotidyltransferase domain-containing protein [Candidatus Thorarchaeota archaeon]